MSDFVSGRTLAQRRVAVSLGLYPVEVARRGAAFWANEKDDLRIIDEVLGRRHRHHLLWGITFGDRSSKGIVVIPLVARHVMEWLNANTPDWGWCLDTDTGPVLTLCFMHELDRVAYTLRFT